MTLKEYLAIERRPEYSGINARRSLKAMVGVRGRPIDRKIVLNNVSAAIRKLAYALEQAQ